MLIKKINTCIAIYALCSFNATFAGNLSIRVIDKEGKPVADAVVILNPTSKGLPQIALPMTVDIVQEKMQFIPAVSVVALGSKVRFVNNDPWDHHVKGGLAGASQFSTALNNNSKTESPAFEFRLEGKSEGKNPKSMQISMNKVGEHSAMLLGCYLHGSMRGFVYVSDSPWANKTPSSGEVIFEAVPAGKVIVKVWQADQLIEMPLQETVVGNSPSTLTIQLPIILKKRRV